MLIYCQKCGKETKEWFEVEFRKKLYREHRGSKKEDVRIRSENIKVCKRCKKLEEIN